ncbi:MAG: hypothetical protein J6C23_06430 [Clostridia bacterium]|nr:hypothetical protein [Clostridia bacterium]
MILYLTKKAKERYSIKTPEEISVEIKPYVMSVIEKEQGDRLYEWGCKLFYFDRKKCLELIHFASKFTVYLIDIKVDDLDKIPEMLMFYALHVFEDDDEMQEAITKYFNSAPVFVYDKLTDKSAISSLNRHLSEFAMDGYRFYEYISNGILHSKRINYDANKQWIVTVNIDGKTDYYYPAEAFERIIRKNFC